MGASSLPSYDALVFCGCGSLPPIGTLNPDGSRLVSGALTNGGSLRSFGTLSLSGSLDPIGTLSLSGSLSGCGTLPGAGCGSTLLRCSQQVQTSCGHVGGPNPQ